MNIPTQDVSRLAAAVATLAVYVAEDAGRATSMDEIVDAVAQFVGSRATADVVIARIHRTGAGAVYRPTSIIPGSDVETI